MDRRSPAQPPAQSPAQQTLGHSPPPQRWQPDRRATRQGSSRPALDRRSGVDKRRQPRMPQQSRQIYPD